jgi:hypothetical protein
MEELLPSPTWQDSAREGMGQTRLWSEKIDLARMTPSDELVPTRYCLAARGMEYLIFQPGNKGQFTVNLKAAPGEFSVEWFDVYRNRTSPAQSVTGGGSRAFTTPFGGPAVLHLKRVGN